MNEREVIEGADAPQMLLSDLPPGEPKSAFALHSSAQRKLKPTDLELEATQAGAQLGGAARLFPLPALILAALAALAGAFPGPAAGIMPLAMDVLAILGPVLAAMLALLAAGVLIATTPTGAALSGSPAQSLGRRLVFAGSGPLTVEIGEQGLQLRYTNQVWRAEWRSFDPGAMMASAINARSPDQGGLPFISEAQAESVELGQLFSVSLRNPAVDRFIAEASEWSALNDFIRLTLRPDPDFAVQAGPKGDKSLLSAGQQVEFLRIDKRFFEAPAESDLTWARFVAACTFMIQLSDPTWIGSTDIDGETAGHTSEDGE